MVFAFIIDPSRHVTGYQKAYSLQGLVLRLMMDREMLGATVRGRVSLLPVCMNGPGFGGLICSAAGFARFLQDMLAPESCLPSTTTRKEFFTPQLTASGQETGMTLGWRTGSFKGEPFFGKAGGGPGFRSNARIYPRLGIGTVWLANETGTNEKDMNAISERIDQHCLP